MFSKKWQKVMVSCALQGVVLWGVITAWAWTQQQITIENVLQSRTVETIITEEFTPEAPTAGAKVAKAVSFENTGTAAVFVRFTYAEYWQMEDALLVDYAIDEYATKNWATDADGNSVLDTDWTYHSDDGWYYYNYVLPAGASIDDVLLGVTFGADIPEGAAYILFFQLETVQASDEADVNTAVTTTLWNYEATVGSDATIVDGALTGGSVTWLDALADVIGGDEV